MIVIPASPSPEFVGINKWYNSQPISISGLRGKVILLDCWTYTCIFCLRMIPIMKQLQRMFAEYEFKVIQAHSAEYEFATKIEYISMALKRYDITEIPVGVDSENKTWQAYGNMYWPKHILIDSNGFLRYEQAGYGGVEEFVEPIFDLIQETSGKAVADIDLKKFEGSSTDEIYETHGMHFPGIAPEICVGYSRLNRFGNKQTLKIDEVNFVQDSGPHFDNVVYLRGKWIWARECVKALDGTVDKNSAIIMKYNLAKRVHAIVGTTDDRPGRLEVLLDGKSLEYNNLGRDAHLYEGSSVVDVNWPFIHNVIKTEKAESHQVEIRALSDNISFYTFVFG
ncbi:MAG TPA: thioredoxin-like domain-containing protein [Nitrososphaeraceae archaeon]|nr:thioredoxin-like domain-containing protein [Nitrososphaeraceae archaeon]